MVYFPYFESQWASHRSLLRSGSHTDLVLVCKGGHQVIQHTNEVFCAVGALSQTMWKVHLHRAMLVTRSPLLADLLLSQESSIISLPQVFISLMGFIFSYSLKKVSEDTVWRLVDLLYSGCCTLSSPANADDLEELIHQLGLEDNVAQLSILEEVQQPQENREEASIKSAMEEVVREALCGESSVKRKRSWSPQLALKRHVKEEEEGCEEAVKENEEVPAMPRDTRICPLCGFACTSTFHLKAHLATNHFLDQLSAMVAPGGFSAAQTKVLHCDICGINISGARTLYRAAVHRASEHGALAPLLRTRSLPTQFYPLDFLL